VGEAGRAVAERSHGTALVDGVELAWAQRGVEADAAAGGAAVQLAGRMVDVPVALQARRLLARVALCQ